MLKKIFISAVLLIAVLSFVVSLLGGNNNNEPKVAVGDRVAVINISGPIVSAARLLTGLPLNRLCSAARRLQPAAS